MEYSISYRVCDLEARPEVVILYYTYNDVTSLSPNRMKMEADASAELLALQGNVQGSAKVLPRFTSFSGYLHYIRQKRTGIIRFIGIVHLMVTTIGGSVRLPSTPATKRIFRLEQ